MEHLTISDELTDEEIAELQEREADMTWDEPTDDQKMRAWDITSRFWAGDWSVLGFCLLVLVLAGVGMLATDAQAQDANLKSPHTINGRIYEYPYIGTPAYSASCTVYRAYEDGYAEAFCSEDGGTYRHDPETDAWSPMTYVR